MTIAAPFRRSLDLAALAWQFGPVAPQPWRGASPAPMLFDLTGVQAWWPAAVPGDVHSDLLASGRIADPFVGDGLAACRWVEGVDWWYRTRLPLGLQPGQRALLEFDGIDYLSAVFVDGHELSCHEGMYSRQVIGLPAELASRAEVELAVRIWGSDALPRYAKTWQERLWGRVAGAAQSAFQPFDDRLATLKTPMHFGWDFAPRLRTMGIWDDARLIICSGVYVRDVYVEAEPLGTAPAGLALPADPGPAAIRLRLALDSDTARLITVDVAVRPVDDADADGWRFEFPLHLAAGRHEQSLAFELPAARLWQPWERGQQRLYRLQLAIRGSGRSVPGLPEEPARPAALDGSATRFGVRKVEFCKTDQGHPWRVAVNGEPFFLRGINWVPLDAFSGRITPDRYATLLEQAKAVGVNFVRVWGGGGRQQRAFYDLCDELGLLVWQEFPIACVFLDHLPRRADYQALLHQEAIGILQALRNHASIFLWCGGNEWSPARNRQAVATLASVVEAEDGARPFIPASPGPGDAHNWRVWHGLAPLDAYRSERASMVSEFGLQAAPAVDSLREFLAEEALWPPGADWQRHNADLRKLERYARWFEDANEAGPLERWVHASQRAQAAGLQILIEHARRRKGVTGGLAVWQWNEPWPSICWSIIDYFGRPKLAFETLQRIMQPLLVSLDYPLRSYQPGDLLQGKLWLVNDGLQALHDCWLRARLDHLTVLELPCVAPASAARPVSQFAVRLPASFSRLQLELHQGNSLLAVNVYDLRFHDAGPDSIRQAVRRRIVDLALR